MSEGVNGVMSETHGIEHERSASPGAGPSKPRIDAHSSDEDEERELFLRKKKDYLELEQSVNSSNELLSSLASYLSTFQHDLSDVSGQISDLQLRSSEIESQLKGRKTIIPPLNALLSDITLPPSLVLTLRDTQPSQNPDLWLQAVSQLDEKITAIQSRGKVKASHEMESIIDGLRISALTQLPPFLLSLIRPLKSASKGLSTNLAVLQTSLLLKYQPFYAFLVKQSPKIAKQVERGYVNAARGYYETAFRRYTRSLGVIKARKVEKTELLGATTVEVGKGGYADVYERLKYSNVDVEGEGGALLAYMADDKELVVPVEAIFRSINLVLLDNASAEFTFLVRFFGRTSPSLSSAPPSDQRTRTRDPPLLSPTSTHAGMSDSGRTARTGTSRRGTQDLSSLPALNLKEAERIFHEIYDPALEYVTTFFQSILYPPPSALPLLTMIRLNEHILRISQQRGSIPLEGYLQGQKMALWPLYRKEMDNHVDSLKRLADEAEGKGLSGFMSRGVRDQVVRAVASRYASIFTSVTVLSEEAEEAMIFSSMTRLRTELVRLVQIQSFKIKSPPERHSYLSSIYDIIMHELVSGPGQTTHPKIQSELSFFRTREEESRRRLAV